MVLESGRGAPCWDRGPTTRPLMRSPGLLDDVVGPHQAAHVPGAVVTASEGLESAGDGVGQHEDGGRHPGGRDDLGGVGLGLPRSGRQRVADGAVALQGDGHQVEGGDAHRDACAHQSKRSQRRGESRSASSAYANDATNVFLFNYK